MAPRTWLTAVALMTVVGAPAGAEEQRRRTRENPPASQQGERAPQRAAERERAVPRAAEPRREEPVRRDQQVRQDEQARRDQQVPRDQQVRRDEQVRRDQQIRRDEQIRRDDQSRRIYDNRRDDSRRPYGSYDGRSDSRRYGYAVPRRYPTRVIRPTIIRVIPYRPYVYRPSYRIGVYYGADGYYPYGYTPRGYYEPIPGRLYGGVRITGAPRDAQVFADGYYVGIVNDFDGIFQHMNLEAGPHHIEIDLGYDAIEFDVYVRPGETTTFRADRY